MNPDPTRSHQKDFSDDDSEQDSAMFDVDEISIATSDSTNRSCSSRTWGPDKVWGAKKNLGKNFLLICTSVVFLQHHHYLLMVLKLFCCKHEASVGKKKNRSNCENDV